jgi:hypothetical protein
MGVKLHESDKFCNIANDDRRGQVFQQLMLRHRWTIPVGANIDPDKFESFRKNMGLSQTEG